MPGWNISFKRFCVCKMAKKQKGAIFGKLELVTCLEIFTFSNFSTFFFVLLDIREECCLSPSPPLVMLLGYKSFELVKCFRNSHYVVFIPLWYGKVP